MNLFQLQKTILSSGQESDFKIECDALTDEDIECCAYLIAKQVKFRSVVGIPRGGLKLADALKKYCISNPFPVDTITLVVDDVLTTGRSMEEFCISKQTGLSKGFVIFSRMKHPPIWITPLFQMNL